MRKARFTEHQIIAVIKSVEAGRTVKDVCRQAGYSPHRHMWVSVTDIDPLAAGMAYIQLSLCGIPGEVVIGNALCDERQRVLLTPVHYWEG